MMHSKRTDQPASMRRVRLFSTAMSNGRRWSLSVGGALIFYAGLWGVAAVLFDVKPQQAPSAGVELRIPSVFGEVSRQQTRSESIPEEKSRKESLPLPENLSAGKAGFESSADTAAASEPQAALLSTDAGNHLPEIDFIAASSGIHLKMPGYPPAARRKGLCGSVTVRITVDDGGDVVSAEIIESTHEWFRRAVMSAVSEWHFPNTANGFVTEKQFVFQIGNKK